MISLLSFFHTCFMRSYRYGPATFVYILGIIFVYSVVPNPVMESYAFSAAFLFVVSVVLCYTIIDIESPNQESVTMLHIGSLIKLYLCKLLYSWIFTLPLALFAVFFPAIFNKFERNPTLEELAMSLLYHVSLSWLAVSLACWFSSKFIRSRVLSFLMISAVVSLAFAVRGISNALPEGLKKIALVLPPLDRVIDVLNNYSIATQYTKLMAVLASLLYGAILCALFLMVIHKRKLDASQS